jgi:uncharacterized protein (DUF427 family)
VPRRIRATVGPHTVLDTIRALYLWEWPFYPQYYIPAGDIDAALIVEEDGTHRLRRGTVTRLGISAGDVRRDRVAHRYLESTVAEIAGTVRFDWDALDAWYEEDEQVFVHPRNPYVRVDALRSTRHVRVELDGAVLAESRAPVLVFETGLPTRWYFDRSAVDFSRLEPSDLRTPCPYKGVTSAYWSVRTDAQLHRDLAWSYDFPTRALAPIAGLVAFYDEQVDVIVDGVRQDRPRTHFSVSAARP